MASKVGELDVSPIRSGEPPEDVELEEESEDDDAEVALKKDLEEEGLVIQGDLSLDFELLKRIPCPYTDIIAEFADVEIFMISVDSLLLEMSAHHYHNWVLGGQTIVLAEQINQFLTALDDLNAKFILVWFADLKPLYEKDQFLQFLHSFVIGYLSQSKWADAMECFQSPLDEKWTDFLYRLTPSFFLFMNKPGKTFVQEEIDFATRFISIAIQLITSSIPVLYLNGFTISFSSVMAYRLSTVPMSITNLESKIAALWRGSYEKPVQTEVQLSAIYACKSVAEFWAQVMKEELKSSKKDDGFEEFCNAVLISALACEKLRTARTYFFFEDAKEAQKGPPPAANHSRRRLFAAATAKLEAVDWSKLTFSLDDLWDGRMILGIYRNVVSKSEILPFRLQDEFAKLHQLVGLKVAVPTDTSDKLLDPLSTPEKKAQKLYIDDLKLCKTDNKLLNEFMPSKTRLKMKIKRLKVTGEWKWNTKDDNCGICRARFEACCTDCKFPGDDCPVVIGACKHSFHMHCIAKWTSLQALQSRAACPLCRQEWKYS